jgi:cobyrinic acid a,c-diamide synthase
VSVLNEYPRIMIAGLCGDSGKTLVSLGLIGLLREAGVEVRAYKKGPDYIDAAWLSWASGRPARNLDSFLMGFDVCRASFAQTATGAGINLIEGNRGIFDGADARGTHSSAELAKRLKAPVLLVVDATKMTRTAAALVLGCRRLDPGVPFAGVILNRTGGSRHEKIIREAIEGECDLPVVGILPRAPADAFLPARHLGLVTPDEHGRIEELRVNILELARCRLDLEAIRSRAACAPPLESPAPAAPGLPDGRGLRIGCLRDSALSFYYPENIEILERAGAALVPVSPLTAMGLPAGLDALYIGGGFPETHGAALSANQHFLSALRAASLQGMPVYAECGGLMLLSRSILWNGARYPMAGIFPWDVEVLASPQGHGYVELEVDRPNPFFAPGSVIKGHEFHYSRIAAAHEPGITACAVRRGTGCGQGRDACIRNNVWASYTHLHALGTPEWARGLLVAAARYASSRPR